MFSKHMTTCLLAPSPNDGDVMNRTPECEKRRHSDKRRLSLQLLLPHLTILVFEKHLEGLTHSPEVRDQSQFPLVKIQVVVSTGRRGSQGQRHPPAAASSLTVPRSDFCHLRIVLSCSSCFVVLLDSPGLAQSFSPSPPPSRIYKVLLLRQPGRGLLGFKCRRLGTLLFQL